MDTFWPWLVVAGLGALHGLSPANGWMFAAAWGARGRDGVQMHRALASIAIGHAASIALVVYAVAQGVLVDRMLVQRLAGALLVGWAAYRCLGERDSRATQPKAMRIDAMQRVVGSAHMPGPVRHAGLALWSCMMATVHGAGLMLVPAVVPLCLSDTPARAITASGSLMLALAAVGVHMAAMLATTGAIASSVCRGIRLHPRRLNDVVLRRVWTAALGAIGVLLMIFW